MAPARCPAKKFNTQCQLFVDHQGPHKAERLWYDKGYSMSKDEIRSDLARNGLHLHQVQRGLSRPWLVIPFNMTNSVCEDPEKCIKHASNTNAPR